MPFLHQQRLPLLHAEAMLLVDDRQAQPLELHVGFEQRVRSDDDCASPAAASFFNCTFSRAVIEPVSRIVT